MLKNIFEVLSRAWSESSQLQHKSLEELSSPAQRQQMGHSGCLFPGPRTGRDKVQPFPEANAAHRDRTHAWRALGKWWRCVGVTVRFVLP